MEDFKEFNNWNRISTATGTLITSGRGRLGAVTLSTAGTAWEITLYDGTTSASTTTIAVIKNNSVPIRLEYDVPFRNGLFVDTEKGTTAGDLLVTYK